jgi:hypothetical protein
MGDVTDDKHFRDILTAKYTNPNTLKAYLNRLKTLRATLEDTSIFTILTNPEIFYPKLQRAYESITTRKNMLTLILSLFREDAALMSAHKDAYAIWKKKHTDLSRYEQAQVKRSEPKEKQIAKYTSYEEITEKYEELKRRGYHDTERHSMQYVLLSVFVHLRPKRADLGAIKIYREKDPRSTTENYIVLRDRGASYLAMNVYKTSKYYQTVEEELPEGLVRDIQTSLRRHPRDYLFRKDDGDPMSNNTYTKFVMNTFQDFFGRATGVSLLRHIYISEKLDFDDMTLEEQDAEAKLMLHTSALQHAYKWPKKTICPKLCADYIKPNHKTRKIKRSPSRRTDDLEIPEEPRDSDRFH